MEISATNHTEEYLFALSCWFCESVHVCVVAKRKTKSNFDVLIQKTTFKTNQGKLLNGKQ